MGNFFCIVMSAPDKEPVVVASDASSASAPQKAPEKAPEKKVTVVTPTDQNVDVEEETVKCGVLPKPKVEAGEHRLETDWTIWWDKKSKANKELPYEQAVVELARFQTIEQFWATFRWLKAPSESARDTSYHVFRYNAKPMWENFLHGGCIIVKLKKATEGEQIDSYWHTLVAAAIGEYFEEPTLVGVGIGTRAKEICLSLWLATESLRVRTRITDLVRGLLKVPLTSCEYKKHTVSLEDKSTFRNAEKLSKKSKKSTKSEKRSQKRSTKSEKTSKKSAKKEKTSTTTTTSSAEPKK